MPYGGVPATQDQENTDPRHMPLHFTGIRPKSTRPLYPLIPRANHPFFVIQKSRKNTQNP